MLHQYFLGMKVFAWYIDMNGIGKKIHRQIPIPYRYQKIRNPHYRYPNGIKMTIPNRFLSVEGFM